MNIDIDLSRSETGNFFFKLFDFCTLFTDHDSWTSRVDVNLSFIRSSLHLDFRNPCMIEPAL